MYPSRGRPWGFIVPSLRSCRQLTGGGVHSHRLFLVAGLFLDCGGKREGKGYCMIISTCGCLLHHMMCIHSCMYTGKYMWEVHVHVHVQCMFNYFCVCL